MTQAEQKRDKRRREIVEAAKRIFAEKGYHGASISDIIKSAGIARGTFYLYFEGKDAVFASILELAIDELNARIIGVDLSEGAEAPALQLHQNVTRVLEYMLSDQALIQLVLNHGLPPDSGLAIRVESFFDHVEERISTSLTVGMAIGVVRECDSRLTAAQILGAIRGGMRSLMKSQGEFSATAASSQLIEFALRGVLTAKV